MTSSRGLLYAIAAYVSWGILPLYWKLLAEVPAFQVLCHRMLWSVLAVGVLLFIRKRFSRIRQILTDRRTALTLVLTALLVSANWLTFIWAVNNGFVLECSLGYFINPLMSVLLGVVVLKERLRSVQILAVVVAASGVAYLGIQYGELPWISLALSLTFALYGLLRKTVRAEALEGLYVETILLCFPAFLFLTFLEYTGEGYFLRSTPLTKLLLVGAGPVTAIPLLWFAHGARLLPLTTIGILQYIAPTLQFLLAVFAFGEEFSREHLIAFCFVWTALLLFTGEGFVTSRIQPKKLATSSTSSS